MPITNTSDYGRHVAQTMLQGFQLGSNIRAQSQQAALALRGQMLQEQQLGLQAQGQALQARRFEVEHQQWQEERLRRKVALDAAQFQLKQAQDLAPLQAKEAAARLQVAQMDLNAREEFAEFGGEIVSALREETNARVRAYEAGTPDPGTPQTDRMLALYPNLLQTAPIRQELERSERTFSDYARYVDSKRERERLGSDPASVRTFEYRKQVMAEIESMVQSGAITQEQGQQAVSDLNNSLLSPTLQGQVIRSREDALKGIEAELAPLSVAMTGNVEASKARVAFKSAAMAALSGAKDSEEVARLSARITAELGNLADTLTGLQENGAKYKPVDWGSKFGATTLAPVRPVAGVPTTGSGAVQTDFGTITYRRTP